MKKNLLKITVILAMILGGYSEASAQCGSFRLFRGRRATSAQYAPNQCGYYTNRYSACTSSNVCSFASRSCSAQTLSPASCEQVAKSEQVNACEAVKTDETVKPCEPVETSTMQEPTCSDAETQAIIEAPACLSCLGRLTCAPGRIVKTITDNVELSRINATRANYGRIAFARDMNLEAGARSHCQVMARYGWLFHARGCGWEIVAQNNDVGITTAISQWLNSPAHCAILLNPNLTRAGVSTFRDRYGRNWCTARFQ